MRSLSAQLLVSVSVLLLIALTLTAFILDRIFKTAAEESTSQRLETQLILLMSSADIDEAGGLLMPEVLPEARFMTPGSGLLGFVTNKNGQQWRSMSAVGIDAPVVENVSFEKNIFKKENFADKEYFQSSLGVEWEIDDNTYRSYVFSAAESLEPYKAQLKEFRTRLFSWFAFLILCIVLAQALLMRWILSPLRKIALEVSEIDQGQREQLSDNYPAELLGVTSNTNALILAERSRLERYRNTLGNLAHSLKTPLAVIQTATEIKQVDKALIRDQVKTMNDIVGYQLKKAATAGQTTLGHAPIDINEVIASICSALAKVYFDKGINFKQNIEDNLQFYADPGDMAELFGNLLDNASKWSNSIVSISAQSIDGDKRRKGLKFVIEDDGKGINDSLKQDILKRGHRADETTPGHGIGLSVVKEIIQSYRGELSITKSDLGGAKFSASLNA